MGADKTDENRPDPQNDAGNESVLIYGGLAISTDPLSRLHAGINYAITKELYFNIGWSWVNDVQPQVVNIGDIASVIIVTI